MIVNYINLGQPQMALREIRPLEKQYPKDGDLKNLMGLVFLAMQNPKVALGYFEQAYRIDPRAPVALNLSSALIESGNPSRAVKILKEVQASPAGKDYQYPERIHHNIGLAAERMRRYDLAEKYYKLALQDNPTYYLSLMRLAAVYEQVKKPGSAYGQYLKAWEACLKCYDPIQGAVKLQLNAGKTQLAVKTIRDYLNNKELEPADRAKAQQLLGVADARLKQAMNARGPDAARAQ